MLAESSYDRILNVLAKALHPLPGMTCVDLGCGTGAFTRRLQRFNLALTGVDISPLFVFIFFQLLLMLPVAWLEHETARMVQRAFI